jgi:deoxyuridine 5'-triphosphate nucleotidohydrolase
MKKNSKKLFVQTENEYLKKLYCEKLKNFDTDSGLDLYVPENVTIPANAIGFKLDLKIKCCMKQTKYTMKSYSLYGDVDPEKRKGLTEEEYENEMINAGPVYNYDENSVFKPYMVFPRSSMGAKTPLRLGNSIGLIDKDYRGSIMLILDNISDKDYLVETGSRLVQIVAFDGEPFGFDLVDQLNDTERGSCGIGSTGK